PPSPLKIPPFKLEGTKLVLGEEGPEYKKMKEEGLIG
ncbi:MAG: ubiquinol-cytochrome c reductase iron-sulfur subunit, partial [Epsilonproteobacteria bacterium]|nr:ubiquinol-cytochrome c reductase iron-sulfur subunit [Campylobacterota bacterium]